MPHAGPVGPSPKRPMRRKHHQQRAWRLLSLFPIPAQALLRGVLGRLNARRFQPCRSRTWSGSRAGSTPPASSLVGVEGHGAGRELSSRPHVSTQTADDDRRTNGPATEAALAARAKLPRHRAPHRPLGRRAHGAAPRGASDSSHLVAVAVRRLPIEARRTRRSRAGTLSPASSATHSPYMADPRARERATRRASRGARQHERRHRGSRSGRGGRVGPRRPPPQPLRWRRAPRGGRRARAASGRRAARDGARRARAARRELVRPARDPMERAIEVEVVHARRPAGERAPERQRDRADRGCWWAARRRRHRARPGARGCGPPSAGCSRRGSARRASRGSAAGARDLVGERAGGSCSVAASATSPAEPSLTGGRSGRRGCRSRRCTEAERRERRPEAGRSAAGTSKPQSTRPYAAPLLR